MNSIELVVFDMAGTTVKDKNYVGLAFQRAMKAYGYVVSVEMVDPIMGYQKPVAIRMMLGQVETDHDKITSELVEKIHSFFVKEMIQFYSTTQELEALPNVEQTFAALRASGVKVALNTGFSRDIAQVIIQRLEWENKIDCLVASDEVPQGRPYPFMIEKIIKTLAISSSEKVAKVGDTEVDINEGFNAGCRFVIGVTTGSFTKAELEPYKPTHIIDDITDVLKIVSFNTVEHA